MEGDINQHDSDDLYVPSEDEAGTTEGSADFVLTNESKRRKLNIQRNEKKYYKPPTAQELERLRETENLYQSSLFRLQTDELLTEVKLQEKWNNKLLKFQKLLKEFLISLPESNNHELTDQEFLRELNVAVPLKQVPFETKGVFKFIPPGSVEAVGSYPLGLMCGPKFTIDLQLLVSKDFWQCRDILNHRYYRKRALYLAYIAVHLKKKNDFGECFFQWQHGDKLRPELVLVPKGSLGKHCEIHLHPTAPADFFKPMKFLPEKKNVRSRWFFGDPSAMDEFPTPSYNHGILKDVCATYYKNTIGEIFEDVTGIKDGIILLKVWLLQRQLNQDITGFSGFIMTLCVAHLLKTRQISKMMSSYQLLRNTFIFLSQADWTSEGITLFKPETFDTSNNSYEVTFMDESCLNNFCANMTATTFERMKHEARLGLELLNYSEGFEALFMQPLTFTRTFDHVFYLMQERELKMLAQEPVFRGKLLDYNGDANRAVLSHLAHLLKKALGKRAILLDHQRKTVPRWETNESPPEPNELLTFGIIVNQEYSCAIIERGPPADDPKSTDFRSFWGTKSDLRRFQDGSICEAVLWPAKTLSERRKIVEKIVLYILKTHAKIVTVKFCNEDLESLLTLPGLKNYGTGEEALLALNQSYLSLTKILRNLDDLPLAITSVQGISPALRYTEVFSPLAVNLEMWQKPKFIYPVEVVLHMEGSGKWPDDVEAIKRVKAAFHIKIAELVKTQHYLMTRAFATHVDIAKDGFVFRLFVASRKELTLLKQIKTSDGKVKFQETKDATQMENLFECLPQLTSALHSLQEQHSVFSSSCRLAKRWVSAHLLSHMVPEICIELLVAHLFLNPEPFVLPGSTNVAFFRFLSMLSQTQWATTPIIVNFNDTFTAYQITELQSWFNKNRASLPPMCILTPYDKQRSPWTREAPTASVLYRLVRLAQLSYKQLEEQITSLSLSDYKVVFRPPLDVYDVIIYLKLSYVHNYTCSIDFNGPIDEMPEKVMKKSGTNKESLYWVGFNHVECYLNELQSSFGNLALFFYDQYGGDFIGVIWKPNALKPQPFKIGNMSSHILEPSENSASLVPNMEAILQDFGIIGSGLVRWIKTKINNWND